MDCLTLMEEYTSLEMVQKDQLVAIEYSNQAGREQSLDPIWIIGGIIRKKSLMNYLTVSFTREW